MKKYFKLIIMFISVLLVTGCEEKLYTYDKAVNDSNNKIANDLVIEKPDNLDRSKTAFSYTAYLKRDKDKTFTILNGQEYLLPFSKNYLCTDFAEVYLLPKYEEFKNKYIKDYKELGDMTTEVKESSLSMKCKDLKFTIDCDNKDNYLSIIDKYIRYLNDDNIYLNETGINRYDIYCKNGGQYYKD